MRQFPRIARIYIGVVIAAGALILALAGWDFLVQDVIGHPRAGVKIGLLVLGGLLGYAASFLNVSVFVRVKPQQRRTRTGKVSLGFLPTFFLLFGLGPFYAMLASAVNMVVMTCYPRRSPTYQILFSVGAITLSVGAAAWVLSVCGLDAGDWQRFTFTSANNIRLALDMVGIIAAAATYAFMNTFLVAGAIGLTTGKSILKIWRTHYSWVIPCYFAGASCATIGFGLLPLLSEHLWASLAVAVIAAPIPSVIYLVYRYHRDQEESDLLHIEELERKNAELEKSREALTRSKEELEHLYTSTVESLALAIDAKDRYTKEHIQRVKEMAVRIAVRLGLEGDDLRAVETGALLHDIGKLAIPEHILSKAGRLTEEEFEKVKCHPDMGVKILEPVNFPFPVMPIVRGHHERWDGKGYPDGLAGEDIPLGARILSVADVYDALTSDRPYRRGWSRERAVCHIRSGAGKHFDPVVVEAFLAVIAHMVPDGAAEDTEETPGGVRAGASSYARGTRVTEEITRASFEYLSLYEISQTASVTLELSETLNLLANKLRLLFNASDCVLLLTDDRNRGVEAPSLLHCGAASGTAEAAFASAVVRIGSGRTIGITERVARTRRGEVVPFEPEDLSLESAPEGYASALSRLKSVMVVPLAVDASAPLIGTVNLYQEEGDVFDDEDLRVLNAISVHVARAIHNAYEFDSTRQSAITDALTGLYNARHLAHFLDRELLRAHAEDRPLTVLVLDLDGFKRVNDRLGHSRGNEVLRDLGRAFQGALRGGDLVARYAGDEYVVVLPGVGPEAAQSVADKIRAVVARYDGRPPAEFDADLPLDGGEEDLLSGIRLGISIGVASFPQDATDAAALIARADRDMYREKNARKEAEEQAVRQLLADMGKD